MRRASQTRNGLLRVAVLSPAASLGGAERSLLTCVAGAGRHGVEPTVFLPRLGPLGEALSRLGVRWQVVAQPDGLICQSRHGLSPGGLASLAWQGPRYLRRLIAAVRASPPALLYSKGP